MIEIEDDEDMTFELRSKKPRNIIFCIDVSTEMNEPVSASHNTGLRQCSVYESTRLESTQRFINRYVVMNKMLGNKDDKYAIVTLSNEATWWYDLSRNSERLKTELSFLESQVTQHYDQFYTQSLFKVIGDNIFDDDRITQAIVFYARSDIVPLNITSERDKALRDSPNFTLDVLFMHNQSPSVQKVYDTWGELDSTVNEGWYYELGSVTCIDRLAKAMTELLAHPLQRGPQSKSRMQEKISTDSI